MLGRYLLTRMLFRKKFRLFLTPRTKLKTTAVTAWGFAFHRPGLTGKLPVPSGLADPRPDNEWFDSYSWRVCPGFLPLRFWGRPGVSVVVVFCFFFKVPSGDLDFT